MHAIIERCAAPPGFHFQREVRLPFGNKKVHKATVKLSNLQQKWRNPKFLTLFNKKH